MSTSRPSHPAPSSTPLAGAMSCGSRGSVAETVGIRVVTHPQYVPDQSDPDSRQYLFTYRIRITNNSPVSVQLLSRFWRIVDAVGEQDEVRGAGVVGQTPRLEPGASFEYSSYCQLRTPWGTMEGSYQFMPDDGAEFDVRIGRFYLVAGSEGAK
jgi:ApaG protein